MNRRQDVYVHFVWSTFGREPMLNEAVLAWLLPCFGEQARAKGCAWAEAGGVADHVHVLVALPSSLPMSSLVQHLKGWTSRAAGATGKELKWQPGYGAFSVSPPEVSRVLAYVRNQAEHHRASTIHEPWE